MGRKNGDVESSEGNQRDFLQAVYRHLDENLPMLAVIIKDLRKEEGLLDLTDQVTRKLEAKHSQALAKLRAETGNQPGGT